MRRKIKVFFLFLISILGIVLEARCEPESQGTKIPDDLLIGKVDDALTQDQSENLERTTEKLLIEDPDFIPGAHFNQKGQAKPATPRPVSDSLAAFLENINKKEDRFWFMTLFVVLAIFMNFCFMFTVIWAMRIALLSSTTPSSDEQDAEVSET